MSIIDDANQMSLMTNSNARDAACIDWFATKMKRKMIQARAAGRSGWTNRDDFTPGFLWLEMKKHITKSDPVDVAIYAMMLAARADSTKEELE